MYSDIESLQTIHLVNVLCQKLVKARYMGIMHILARAECLHNDCKFRRVVGVSLNLGFSQEVVFNAVQKT